VRSLRRTRRPLIALIALLLALGIGYGVKALDSGTDHPAIHVVKLSTLPPQAAVTVRLIQRGGPFPYPENDGVTFYNDEGLLPSEPQGYYREYTVPTPGSPDRGTRRIVTGSGGQYYYTGDHYESFERVDIAK
jgi:guanyl-specific ribonuclease Sa